MNIVLNWLVSALVLLAVAYILPGVSVTGFFVALVVALVLGLINAFLKPLAILLTLPVTLFTLGLFIFVLNALFIMLTAFIVPGFEVANFWWALLFSLILSLVHSFIKKQSRE